MHRAVALVRGLLLALSGMCVTGKLTDGSDFVGCDGIREPGTKG